MTTPPDPTPPHARNLRAGRYSEPRHCYAITKTVEGRRPVLAGEETSAIITGSLDYLRNTDQIRLLAFCIMPDHYHTVMFVLHGKSLSEIMESVGKFTSLRLNRLLGGSGRFWQDGFYDHRCRDEDDIEDRLVYVEHNPVRAGLVERAGQWPYSSACALNHNLLDRDWYSQVR
ncbi:MAG: transposase [Planctomycetes bacterium]|nr:transposase [Planctomycetota bacterium]